MAVIESTSTSAKNVRKENSIARIVGSGSAGILELAFFHPVTSGGELTDHLGRYYSQTVNE
jgi:hypothetical protein